MPSQRNRRLRALYDASSIDGEFFEALQKAAPADQKLDDLEALEAEEPVRRRGSFDVVVKRYAMTDGGNEMRDAAANITQGLEQLSGALNMSFGSAASKIAIGRSAVPTKRKAEDAQGPASFASPKLSVKRRRSAPLLGLGRRSKTNIASSGGSEANVGIDSRTVVTPTKNRLSALTADSITSSQPKDKKGTPGSTAKEQGNFKSKSKSRSNGVAVPSSKKDADTEIKEKHDGKTKHKEEERKKRSKIQASPSSTYNSHAQSPVVKLNGSPAAVVAQKKHTKHHHQHRHSGEHAGS